MSAQVSEWLESHKAHGPKPVATFGLRDRAWLHPFRPWFVELAFLRDGSAVCYHHTLYARTQDEAVLIADGFLFRHRN